MHQSPARLLFPRYRRCILALLLLRPEDLLRGREIARRTGLPHGTLTRELKQLAEVGFLKSEKRGNQALYSANRTSPIFTELASILRKTSGLADLIAVALAPFSDRIDVACIFGSVARAAEHACSDVDLLILGSVDCGLIIDALYPVQKQLSREINPKVFTILKWKAKLKTKNAFAINILIKQKIFLLGNENELGKLGGRQS